MAGGSRGRRRRALPVRCVALFATAFILSAVSSGAIAAQPEKKKPPPTPSPTPEPSPSPEPSAEPSPAPSPDPTPSPTHTSSPIPDPTPSSPPGGSPTPPGDDPPSSGGAPTEGDTPLGSSDVPPGPYQAALDLIGRSGDEGDPSSAREGTGSLFTTVASIIDELASSDDRAIGAAEAPTSCPGFACPSPTDATEDRALLFIVVICLSIAFAGVLVIRAKSRRSTSEPLSDRA